MTRRGDKLLQIERLVVRQFRPAYHLWTFYFQLSINKVGRYKTFPLSKLVILIDHMVIMNSVPDEILSNLEIEINDSIIVNKGEKYKDE